MKASSDPGKKTVLIVDDDAYICLFLKTLLEKEGFRTAIASDGDEALKKAERQPFDLITLDWMMPVLSGFDVLQELQKDEKRKVPVVVITAHVTDRKTIEKILKEMNVVDFMTKPIDNRHFVRRVHEILKTTPFQ